MLAVGQLRAELPHDAALRLHAGHQAAVDDRRGAGRRRCARRAGHPDLSALVDDDRAHHALAARGRDRQHRAGDSGGVRLRLVLARASAGHHFLDADDRRVHASLAAPAAQRHHLLRRAHRRASCGCRASRAGWLENWAVYRRLPEAIAEPPLGRFVGRGTMGCFSRFFTRNISGLGGNSALGLMLGMTPVMGKFFGLPLDVRHVTLSTGALTLRRTGARRRGALQRGLLGSGARHRHHRLPELRRQLRAGARGGPASTTSRTLRPPPSAAVGVGDVRAFALSVFHSAAPKPRGTSSRTGVDSTSPGNLIEGFLS